MPIKLNIDETEIILHCKGWSPWERRKGLIKLYEKQYQYKYNPSGVYTMVSSLFYKIWGALGANTNQLDRIFIESLPSNNWIVGGQRFGVIYNPETDKFNNEEITMAMVMAMASYLMTVEAKDIELAAEPEEVKWV